MALIAAFVLLLGVGALASRSNLGFIGQAFQTQNRQARDVAETAIAEFANTLNREPNRYMLIAGDTSEWVDTNAAVQNPCTQYDSAGNQIAVNPTPPQAAAITRFAVGATQNLAGNANRKFRVESVTFLKDDRSEYDPSDAADADYISQVRAGVNRPLIRITVVGEVVQPGGRISTARVAREFEVVPKCCKRSFGRNTIGGVNWGRDDRACEAVSGGNDGVIVGMNGGGVTGSNNQKDVYDESCTINADGTLGSDCEPVSQLLCWGGNGGGGSDLNGTPNSTCTDGDLALGNPDTTGISFVPEEFSFDFPDYNNPAGTPNPQYPTITIPNNQQRFITYFNNGTNPAGIRICQLNGANYSNYSNCVRLDGVDPATATTPDPCYRISSLDLAATPPRPYHRYNCQLRNIVLSNPNSALRIDTTAAQINLLFYNSSYTGLYLGGAGGRQVTRVHCRSDLSAVPSGTASCTQAVDWDTFLERCTLPGCEGIQYDVRRLANLYANGSGSFNLNGTAAGVAFNLYAPYASVDLRGGGGARPNFMGRLWVNDLYLNGSMEIFTFASGADGDGPGGGIPIIDFIARSFTQSSGFGLN